MPINVTKSSMPSYEAYCEEIRDLWDSRWLTNNGGKLKRLEAALCEYFGARNVVTFVNGHLALEAAIAAMGLAGEVITTPYTFASTTHALVRKGLTPVFADVRESDFTLDPDKLEALVTPRTCAIVPVHVYGLVCQTEAIDAVAKRHGLKVLYDAAHAFGASVGGRSAACFGDAAMLSFHATKVFNTIEGGAVVTDNDALAERLRLERNYGIVDEDTVVSAGGNAKMNEFQAAMGLLNLPRVAGDIRRRRALCERYAARLSGTPGLRLLQVPEGEKFNYAYMPVVFEGGQAVRDAARDRLAACGICARKYFFPLVTDFDCYLARFDSSATPVAERASRSVLTLPLYPELDERDVERVCDLVLG